MKKESKQKKSLRAFQTEVRKEEHLTTVLNNDVSAKGISNGFETYTFEHCALPDIDFKDVDLSMPLFGKVLKAPILISSMTGGTPKALKVNQRLAEIAQEINLGKHLLLGQGEEQTGGRNRTSNLSRAFEAILGAIFLDQGYKKVNEFVSEIFQKRLNNTSINLLQDPKSRLQELIQQEKKTAPVYQLVQETGPDHHKLFTVEVCVDEKIIGYGNGKRKLEAERNAAEDALKKFTH